MGVLRGISDDIEDLSDIGIGNTFVKKVAHGVDEIYGRLLAL
jgi:hypothetical protein